MKKCIVLDLDNTLWGGIVGEDGKNNLKLSMAAPGSGFVAFQQALLDHAGRGVILAINSRNNPEDAWDVIRTHPNMILKEKDFAAVRINWQDKADNLRELAQELNIGLDSMVFLDDDPTNRAMVRALVPEVETPDLPENPMEYARFLGSLPYFPKEATTSEDAMRTNMYVTERLRMAQESQHKNKEDFLKGLGLELQIFEDDDSSLSRLSQLTDKTNQFNTLKRPYTEDELRWLIKSPQHTVLYGKLGDIFGDYGIVIMALVDKNGTGWSIRQMLMSCRVFGRGVEDAFLSAMMAKALASGADELTIDFAESDKNAPAKEFVGRMFKDSKRRVSKLNGPDWIRLI